MKKVFSVVAIALMSLSMFSSQLQTSSEEKDALYQNLSNLNADGDDLPIIVRPRPK